MKTKAILNAAISCAIGLSTSFAVFSAPTTDTSSTRIEVTGSKGGNYGFTLTMEEADVMYYDATSKKFISQKVSGLDGKASLFSPAAGIFTAFSLEAALDDNVTNSNTLLENVLGSTKGVKIAPVIMNTQLTHTPQKIDLASWAGVDPTAGSFADKSVILSLVDTGEYTNPNITSGDDLPVGEYKGHADIEWTTKFDCSCSPRAG
ncbi:hypothetical protein [Aeromonas sobria]|uniref:hypothetical protein n=1 Tax=Aeromonas sobria TaxID=646 RepID=UPI003F30DDBC